MKIQQFAEIKILGFYARTSLVILIALMISICLTAISMVARGPMPDVGYTGLSFSTLKSNMNSHYSVTEGEMYDFRKIFSIMFPSVTGTKTHINRT